MVFDSRPGEACLAVQRMLARTGLPPDRRIAAARGRDWALAAAAPAADEPTCGAGVATSEGHVLAWTGDLLVPDDWRDGQHGRHEPRMIGTAVLRRLARRGLDCLAEVDGSFCGAWYDPRADRWQIFNDKLGLIPVFWTSQRGRDVIGPTPDAVRIGAQAPPALWDEGLTDLLRTGNMVDDRTLIRGVRWLIGGHVLTRTPQGLQPRCYWEFRHLPVAETDVGRLVDSAAEVLERCVRRQADTRSPLLLGLSGGMDSRCILAAAHATGRVPFCFTTGTAVSEDVRFAPRVARAAGAAHQWLPYEPREAVEPLMGLIRRTQGLHSARHLAAAAMIPRWLEARRPCVLLEGYLMGALAGVHLPDARDMLPDRPPHQWAWACARLHGGGRIEAVDDLLRPDLARSSFERWAERIDRRFRQAQVDDPVRKAEFVVVAGRSGRNDVIGTWMLTPHAVLRCPGSDRAMLDWYAAAPPDLLRGKRFHMELIRRRYPRFARAQRASYDGLPLTTDAWSRNWCWQKEKLFRAWARLRHPWTREVGLGAAGMLMLTLRAWKASGALDMLLEPDARVLECLRRDSLKRLWHQADVDKDALALLMGVATAEIALRDLEDARPATPPTVVGEVRFRSMETRGKAANAATAEDVVGVHP